ncbi:MAG: TraX family protein [Peptococcaceae bacterium]|nr:TraX family protein [Peptococcaceae bacterium]
MKINGSTLKWFAMASMVIDHLAAVVLMPAFGIFTVLTLGDAWQLGNDAALCYGMRQIGRIAFPIFCFLLVEGLVHTHSRGAYLRNLIVLAVVSEMPYNLCRTGNLIDFSEQSTIWTLVLGFLTCCGLDWLDAKSAPQPLALKKAALVGAAMLLAWFLNTDYDAFGVAFIVLLYLLRNSRTEQCMIGAIVCLFGEAMAALAFVPIYFYNGQRGKQPKWLFYAFYPTHLLVLYFTRLWWIGW